MAMRVAIIGYGAVAAIHAAKLRTEPGADLVSIYGPNREKAAAFARSNGILSVCGSVAEALANADVAIVCSPTSAHLSQARECLERGVNTLVEMPPCESSVEAEALAAIASRQGVKLGCAHTSRFVPAYAKVKQAIASGLLGSIQAISYERYHQLRDRSWRDNALLHHSAHPVDLVLDWCGGLAPKACVALPDSGLPQTVSVLGRLPSGGAATITVTYASRIHHIRMMIVGQNHTVETDGFSYAKSDLPELSFSGDAQEIYEEAIHAQDREFLGFCAGTGNFVSWDATVKVLRAIDQFRELAA